MTEPGELCPVCRVPDPAHDWDEHERQAAGVEWTGPAPEGALEASSMVARSSSRGGAEVRWLAVHSTEGIMRAVDLRAWSSWPGSSHASADAGGVLLDGAADGFVPHDRASWTLRNGNPVSENIELCAWARYTRTEWLARPLLLERCAEWLAARHKARGIPLRKLTVAQVRAGWAGVIDHDDYTDATGDGTHWDVGEAFPWDVVIPRAQQLAAPAPPPSGGFMADLTEAEQREALGYLRDLHYGLRRPVINGVTLSTSMRGVQNGVAKLLEQHPTTEPLTAAGELEPLPWSDDEVRLLGEQLAVELTPEQQRALVEAFAR